MTEIDGQGGSGDFYFDSLSQSWRQIHRRGQGLVNRAQAQLNQSHETELIGTNWCLSESVHVQSCSQLFCFRSKQLNNQEMMRKKFPYGTLCFIIFVKFMMFVSQRLNKPSCYYLMIIFQENRYQKRKFVVQYLVL